MALGRRPSTGSPRLARWLLRLAVRDPDYEFLVGDLEEIYREIASRRGRWRAASWYWKQSVGAFCCWTRRQPDMTNHGPEEEGSMFDRLKNDLLFAIRLALKRPAFSAVVILTLALGIGANTAVYTLTDAFLFRGLPVPQADRMVSIFSQNRDGTFQSNLSYAQIRDFDEQSQSLAGVLGFSLVRASLDHDGLTEMVFGEAVTGNYFDVLGVAPHLGRTFLAEERGRGNAQPVVVLSHGLWQRRFGSDVGILGTVLTLNGVAYTVVGVAPPEFTGSKFALSMSFWIPLQSMPQFQKWDEWDSRRSRWLNGFGRLQAGFTLRDAQTELEVISRRQQEDYPGEQLEQVARAHRARGVFTELNPSVGSSVNLASGLAVVVALLVLAIACANVANLLLARTATRISEMGLRMAIGASRLQLLRQLSLESLVLAVTGGVLGIGLAVLGTAGFPLLFPKIAYDLHFPTHPSLPVLGITLLVALLTGLFFGIVPLLALRRDGGLTVQANLSGSRSVTGSWNSRRFLVVFQLAASLLLLAVSGLFVRSLQNARGINPGFSNSNLLMATVDLELAAYTPETGMPVLSELESSLASLPGVQSVGMTTNLPLDDSGDSVLVWARGIHLTRQEGISAEYALASAGLFSALGVELREGRLFDGRDNSDSPRVVLISGSLASRLWPGESAAGKMLSTLGPEGPFVEVAGVVDDIKYESLASEQQPAIYLSLGQRFAPVLNLVLRTSLPPEDLASGLRETVREINPNIPVFRITTFRDQVSNLLWPARMGAVLASIFGVIALLLATIGLYGLMSFAVSRRIREMGIRTALGANPQDLLRLVLLSGARMVLSGVVAGAFISWLAARPISSILYGVEGFDGLTFAAVATILGGVAMLACYLPARRAARIDPMQALRYE